MRKDLIVIAILLALPLALFAETTLGGKTLIPADNLYQWEPWASYAAQMGVGIPHNELLSDLVLENYVWKRFILRSLHQPGGITNRLPLWNPYLWAGAPFLADGQHSAMYPFSVLFYIIPLPAAYGWFTVLQFWLAGIAMYILARTLGTNRIGGLIAGVTYQLSSVYVVSVVFTMIIAAMVWLPLLLALIEGVIRSHVRGDMGRAMLCTVGGALALGCQMLAGHPEYTYYTALVMTVYATARLLKELIARRAGWRPVIGVGLWLLLMAALGGCLGAAQFIPLYEYARLNFRQGAESYATIIGWAFPKRRLIAMLIPNFFGNPTHHTWFDILRWQRVPVERDLYGNPTMVPHTVYWGIKNAVEGGSYLGILPLFLALIALLGRACIPHALMPRRWREDKAPPPDDGYRRSRFYVWFFAALAAFSLTLVFGLPTYRLVFALPGINQLHSPFRWLFPYTLGMAVLAGIGATYLSGNGRQTTSAQSPYIGANTQRFVGWPAFWGGIGLLILLLAALPLADHLYPLAERAVRHLALADRAFESGRMFFMYQWRNVFLFALMLTASGAILRITRCPIYLPQRLGGYAVWKPLAVTVIALDLFIIAYGFNPAADPRWLDFTPPAIAFLQERQAQESPFRLISYNAPGEKTLNANTPWLYDLQDARGYGSIIPRQYADYMKLIYDQYELLYNRIAPVPTTQPQALDSPLIDLLNICYVVTTQEIDSPRYRQVYDGEVRIYRNQGCMPRAFTLPDTSAVYTQDIAAALQKYDPRHYVLLDGDTPTQPVPGQAREATITRYTHNEVFVEVDLAAPGWLILSDSYLPGWRAYRRPRGGSERDEVALPLYRHAGNFRAVHLEAGQHTVRFKYTPTSVKVGFFLSFLGGIVVILLLLAWIWQRLGSGDDGGGDARRVAKNSVAPIVLQLFNKAIDTAFMMLALRILTPYGAGQYYFVVNIIVYTDILINFGLNTFLQREVSRAREQGSRYLVNAVILRVGLCLAAAPLLAAFVILWPWLARLLAGAGQMGDAVQLDARQVWALALFAVGLLPANVAAALTAIFQANERMEHPAAITVVSTVLKAGLGTVALLAGWGIVGLGAVSIVTNLVTLTILAVLAGRLFSLRIPRSLADRAVLKEMVCESWPLMVNNLLSMGFFKADVILLKAMRGDIVLGLYSGVAYKVIDAINIVPSSFTFALFPLMSRYADTSREAMSRAYRLAVRLLVIIALPLAFLLTVLAYPLARIIGGSGYMPDSAIALQLMIWSIPLGFVNSVTHYVLIALGRQRQLTLTFLIGLAFNIVANTVAIPIWSYRASAVIHILSEGVLLGAFYILLRRDLPPVPWGTLLWRPLLAGMLMVSVGVALWGSNLLLTAVVPLLGYALALWALGIAHEPDMEIVAAIIPSRIKSAVRKGIWPLRQV